MSNSLLTPTVISKAALSILENNLVLGTKVYRDDQAFTAKIGTSHTIRKPVRFTVSDGAALDIQDVTEPSVVMTINQQKHVAFQFTAKDLALTIEEFSDRYLKEAMTKLAATVDSSLASLYSDVHNATGTPGTDPNTFAIMATAPQRLDEMAAPMSGRCAVLDPGGAWALAGGLSNNFVTKTSEKALIKGYVSEIAGLDVYMSQSIKSHTNGYFDTGSTGVAHTGTLTGATITSDGWANSTVVLKAGDVIQFGSVYAVNPQTYQSTGQLADFVVTSDVTSSGAGAASIPISPAIVTSGATQNVTAAPADGAAITVKGSESGVYAQNLVFCKEAFGLAMADLEMPQGVDFAARRRYKGFALRVVRDYDINNDNFPCRIDVLYGVKTLYPELAVRLYGN